MNAHGTTHGILTTVHGSCIRSLSLCVRLDLATAPSPYLFAQSSLTVLKSAWSSQKLLEWFHVCPLLFRERMEGSSVAERGQVPSSDRPVYRYIFSCPGLAQALVRPAGVFSNTLLLWSTRYVVVEVYKRDVTVT